MLLVFSDVYRKLRNVCWNYADDSPEMRLQLGEAGLLETCTDEVRNLYKTYKDSEVRTVLVQNNKDSEISSVLYSDFKNVTKYLFTSLAEGEMFM